jgi:CheY-like chemotaxis protein
MIARSTEVLRGRPGVVAGMTAAGRGADGGWTMETDAAAITHAAGASPAALAPGARRRPRVLVVEDDDQMRRMLVATLTTRGCDVVEAEQGVDLLGWMGQAMESPTDDALDAIVSDVNLPDMTALEVLSALRARDATVPVILVTASEDEEIHRHAYDLGATVILKKPLDLDDLSALVRALTAPGAGGGSGARGHA